jgi:hypothetical protein
LRPVGFLKLRRPENAVCSHGAAGLVGLIEKDREDRTGSAIQALFATMYRSKNEVGEHTSQA